MKKITVFSSRGKSNFDFNSHAKNWQELKLELEKMNIFTEGMQTIIGEKDLREENIEVLPEADFSLFILPETEKIEEKPGMGEAFWKQFLGAVKFDEDPVEYQRKLRDEWE
jgi:hypothetical protein